MGAELLLLFLALGAGTLKAAQKIKGRIRRRFDEEVRSIVNGMKDN